MIVRDKTDAKELGRQLAVFAVESLLEELYLTPKPGLVDKRGCGSHFDLDMTTMEVSAYILKDCFFEIAMACVGRRPSQQMREQLAAVGRYGEENMLKATGQINTHKGAIWAIGLLTGAAAIILSDTVSNPSNRHNILLTAGAIASFEDRFDPKRRTNGSSVRESYKVRSAREEAKAGFPSLREAALPAWDQYHYEQENTRKLNVLLSLMAVVDDTCILHRSNLDVLCEIKQRAAAIMRLGGLGCTENWRLYDSLDKYVSANWVSPGGSADLLAATLFVQKIMDHYKTT